MSFILKTFVCMYLYVIICIKELIFTFKTDILISMQYFECRYFQYTYIQQ